jgi:REP element-mobilizing transposase RayT
MPDLRKASERLLKGPPVYLRLPHAEPLFAQFQETAQYRHWTLIAVAIMRAHLHLLIGVPGDPNPEDLLRDFKAYGSRSLNQRFSRPKGGT